MILLLLAALISIPQSHNADPFAYSDSILFIYQANKLPANAAPVFAEGNQVLAFGSPQSENNGAIAILPEDTGDYYLMRADIPGRRFQINDSIPHIFLDEMIIIKATPSQAEKLAKNGWGLTRLNPNIQKSIFTDNPIPPTITDVDPDIADMISIITPQSSRQILSDLCAIPTRYSFAQGCREAEQYVYNKFNLMNLIPSYYIYDYSETTMRDVIGQLTGTVYPESIIIVCAHLDCTSETPNTLAPGAEDNGSGCAVILEAARAFSFFETAFTVRFIAFTGEEQGLIGSDSYATAIQRQGEMIKAVINVDMVGYSGPYAEDMHVFSDPQSYGLGALGSSIIAEYTDLDTITHYEQAPRYGSDHYPFAIRNYPAIFFIDAWDDFDWYPYYHTVSDTIGNLNLDQQTKIAQAVTAMTATLAHPDFGIDYLPGDANGSGGVNGIDVVFLVNYLKGGMPPEPLLSGDANGDCSANGLDVVYLVNFLKGGRPPFGGNCR